MDSSVRSIIINQHLILQPTDKVHKVNTLNGSLEVVNASELKVSHVIQVNGRRMEITHLNNRNRHLDYLTRG